MIYSCKDVTLQNRKFSEFIDIDDKELLPGSVDNDTIYLSGYVEGDENNQNIKIKVSQLAKKVATDTELVTNITEGVVNSETITGTITEKVKDTVAEYIKGNEGGEPSEVEKIIDEKINEIKTSESLENYYTKTEIDGKNFIFGTDYATTDSAGLVKLEPPPTTTFSLRTISTGETDVSIPSVYTASDVDAKLSELEGSLGEAINDAVSDKVSNDDEVYKNLITAVNDLNDLSIHEKFNEYDESFGKKDKEITNIKREIGPSIDDNKNTLWDSINSLTTDVTDIFENYVTNDDLGGAITSFSKEIDKKFVTLEKENEDISTLTKSLETNISDINTKIGQPLDNETITNIWSKIYSLKEKIDSNKTDIDGCKADHGRILDTANHALEIAESYHDEMLSLGGRITDIESEYLHESDLDERLANFVKNDSLNDKIGELKDYVQTYTDDEISKLNIGSLENSVNELQGAYSAISGSIEAITNFAKTAETNSLNAIDIAEAAKTTTEGFESRLEALQGSNDQILIDIAGIKDKNNEQDTEITTAKQNVDYAVETVNKFEGRIQNLEEELDEDGYIKTTLTSQGTEIINLKNLVGEGPIKNEVDRITIPEGTNTVVAHINNIIDIIDRLDRDVNHHCQLIDSHTSRLSDITDAIGGHTVEDGSTEDGVIRPYKNAKEFDPNTAFEEWPEHFSDIPDLWSGLYCICDIVGFDHYNELLPAEPDKRNIITELSDLSTQIKRNTDSIGNLNDRLDLFNSATGTAELNRAGIVSVISSVDDEDYIGGDINIADPDTTAVSIDYFEKHKPAPFVEGGEEENQYRKKGTVYVQYKNQDDNNEQPIVYSKAAIDSKLDEEYSKKDSGLNYNTDGVTFSLGNNSQIPQSIKNVPVPMNCPAMCVTREGIYVTVFYGENGVAEPQENNRGWRWVMLGTVPQEFVASDTSGPATS